MSLFGSLSWAQQRGGVLSAGERLEQAFRGAASLVVDRSTRMGRRLGLTPRAVKMLFSEIPMPRSPAVMAAEGALAGAAPWVLSHSMRTYLFGALLGARDGLRVDSELLLVASLLHDIGLVRRQGPACFAHRGALLAREIARNAGLAEKRSEVVAEAICAHLNVRPSTISPEAALLRAGAGLDVAGDRFNHIHPETRHAVVAAWSRDDFAPSLKLALREEVVAHPGTRIAFLCGTLGFLRLIEQADRRFSAS